MSSRGKAHGADTTYGDNSFSFETGGSVQFNTHNAFISELANDRCRRPNERIDCTPPGFDLRGQSHTRLDMPPMMPEIHAMVENAIRRNMQFLQSHQFLHENHHHSRHSRAGHHSISFSQSSSFEQHGDAPPTYRYSSRFQADPDRNENYMPVNYRPAENMTGPRQQYYPSDAQYPGYNPARNASYQRPDSSYTRPENYQPYPNDNVCTTAGDNIVACANKEVGQSMWACSPYASGTDNGRLGCAASVSEVLKRSGYSYANSAGVQELASQLTAHGWQKINVADHPELVRPGDVVYGIDQKPGKSAHIGIIGECQDGQIYQYDNNSANGKWSHCKLDESALNVKGNQRFGKQMWVLRPPESDSKSISV